MSVAYIYFILYRPHTTIHISNNMAIIFDTVCLSKLSLLLNLEVMKPLIRKIVRYQLSLQLCSYIISRDENIKYSNGMSYLSAVKSHCTRMCILYLTVVTATVDELSYYYCILRTEIIIININLNVLGK